MLLDLWQLLKYLWQKIRRHLVYTRVEEQLTPPITAEEAYQQMRWYRKQAEQMPIGARRDGYFQEATARGERAVELCTDKSRKLDYMWAMIRLCLLCERLYEASKWVQRTYYENPAWLRDKVTREPKYRDKLETILFETSNHDLWKRIRGLFMMDPDRTPQDEESLAQIDAASEAMSYEAVMKNYLRDPEDPGHHEEVALELERLGYYEDATKAMERALGLKDWLYYQLYLVRLRTKWAVSLPVGNKRDYLLNTALLEAKTAVSSVPTSGYCLRLLGYVHHAREEYDEAVKCYKEAQQVAEPYTSDGLQRHLALARRKRPLRDDS